MACRQSPNPALYPVVVMALATGGRKNEIRCLQWSAVDLDAGVVRFLQTKTDQPRAVPVSGETLEFLRGLAQTRRPGVPWVFSSDDGTAPRLIETAWRTARQRSGIRQFRFHDLHHTFASYMAMSGATLREIADVLGHANIQMTMRYAHLLPSHTAGVVSFLGSLSLEDTPDGRL